MTASATEYRLDGIYRQRQDGFFMQRVKLAAGVISAVQARSVAEAALRFGRGTVHLTTRGSMEIHWVREHDLPALKSWLASTGLTSRGACGGAVRGVTCSSQGAVGFPAVESLARRLHRHFTANPRFERLPKKFKIGIEADSAGRRHLIQDVGLVLSAENGKTEASYDVYVAGGLGREPQPAFLFEKRVNVNRVIPIIEAIARVYAARTPAGKRLKHLIRDIGEEEFRRLVSLEPSYSEQLPAAGGLPDNLVQVSGTRRVVAQVCAGELQAGQLQALAGFSEQFSGGILMVTADQDIAFQVDDSHGHSETSAALEILGFGDKQPVFRVCPGSHLCLVGLSPTRDVSRSLIQAMGPEAVKMTWALSGCPNSCTQPQLADLGIISSSLAKNQQGERLPRFDLLRQNGEKFATAVDKDLTLEELLCRVQELG